jgi:hypothetical protein
MIDQFTLKLILSFIIGGGYAILATVSADKLGTKIGGLITGLPSTVLFGLLFIAWTQNTQAAVEATTLLPATIGASCFFLIMYVYFIRYSLWFALGMAFLIWGLLTYALLAAHLTNFILAITIFCISFIIAYIIIVKLIKPESAKGRPVRYTIYLLFFRGILTGTVIAFSVFIAKIGGPIIGGVFTTFPAMISSVLIINYLSHGPAFSLGIAKSTLFAWISTTIYVIVAYYTMIPLGMIGGTIVALAACYLSAYFLLIYILPKHS